MNIIRPQEYQSGKNVNNSKRQDSGKKYYIYDTILYP
jgi:hypothetical protein